MKRCFTTCLAGLTLLLVAARVQADDGRNVPPKIFIPKIARIGGVQIGYSTQADLAKHWGEGKTTTGGHSNSGRLWRVKGTRWILSTDGFEYSERGLVVDGFALYEYPKLFWGVKLLDDAPSTRLSKKDFVWLGGIAPGMTRDRVMGILKRKSLPITPTQDGCEISVRGFHGLTSNISPLRMWRARLVFTNDSLSALLLDASFLP